MPTVLLIRHGRTTANASGILAGWSPGIELDDVGRRQAAELAVRLREVPLRAIVTSPLERTRQTAAAIVEGAAVPVEVHVDDAVGECHYGDWTGRDLKSLARDPLWKVVQSHPSAVVFPGGESMSAMQHRAVVAIRAWNEKLGADAVYAVVSHGDVIKAIVADALGTHLDLFQRISCDPCSVSVISYTAARPFVVRVNDTGGSLASLVPAKGRRGSDAVVGGGAGSTRARRPASPRRTG